MPLDSYSLLLSLHSYLGTFFHGIVAIALICEFPLKRSEFTLQDSSTLSDYIPIYFQATQLASAIGSGVDMLPVVVLIPVAAVITGTSVQKLGRYRPQNWTGWVFMIVGFGLLSILTENSSRAAYVGLQIPAAIGVGIIWISTPFAILAPLPFSNSAHALSFFIFTRQFAQVRSFTNAPRMWAMLLRISSLSPFLQSWGMTIAGAIIQNVLNSQLPADFIRMLPQGAEVAYASIPIIPTLKDPLRTDVRRAYAHATRTVWQTTIGIAAAGLFPSLLMRA